MPCRVDEWNDWNDIPKATKRYGLAIEDFEAILCGLFTLLEADKRLDVHLTDIDWNEVGVSRRMVEAWWKEHKREDERRRKKEAAEREKIKLREAALAKLTVQERKALGL